MEFDEDAAAHKKRALVEKVNFIANDTISVDDFSASSIIDSFATITPPEKLEFMVELVTLNNSRRPRGRSQKPGNVLLNWRKLIDKVPETSLAVYGASTLPSWAVVLAGLSIWNSLIRSATEEFSTSEAVIMLALWKNRNENNRIVESAGFDKTNEVLTELSMPHLSLTEFATGIDRLTKIRCLKLADGMILLNESINVKY